MPLDRDEPLKLLETASKGKPLQELSLQIGGVVVFDALSTSALGERRFDLERESIDIAPTSRDQYEVLILMSEYIAGDEK